MGGIRARKTHTVCSLKIQVRNCALRHHIPSADTNLRIDLPKFNLCVEAILVGIGNKETLLRPNFGTIHLKQKYLRDENV